MAHLLEACLDHAGASGARPLEKFVCQVATLSTSFRDNSAVSSLVRRLREATRDLVGAASGDAAQDALDRGADPNAPLALHRALECGFLELVLDHPEFDAVDCRDAQGYTAMQCACIKGDLVSAKALAESCADVDLELPCGCSLLHHAIEDSDADIAQLLIEFGADVNARRCNDLKTPLHLAVEDDDMELVDLLATNRALDLRAQDSSDASPLACAVGSDGMVALLLELGAAPDISALQLAASVDATDDFEAMLEHAVISTEELRGLVDSAGPDARDILLTFLNDDD